MNRGKKYPGRLADRGEDGIPVFLGNFLNGHKPLATRIYLWSIGPMDFCPAAADYLTMLNIIVALFGVLLVAGLGFEWVMLRHMRQQLQQVEKQLRADFYKATQAAHKVIASYGLRDPGARVKLLESVVKECPDAYNAWNSLGYAYLDEGDTASAIEAFTHAVARHPEEKAGYCDLAAAYLSGGNEAAAIRQCKNAIQTDPSAKADILADPRFAPIAAKI